MSTIAELTGSKSRNALQREAVALLSDLLKAISAGEQRSDRLAISYGNVIPSIRRIEIVSSTKGAFEYDGITGVLQINEGPVRTLFKTVDADIYLAASNGFVLAPDQREVLHQIAFALYFLHEIRHISQGLSEYSTVRWMTDIYGRSLIGDFDLIADFDAALAYAAISQIRSGNSDRESFLITLKEAYYFSGQYFFTAFSFPMDRPEKIARAMSIVVMAARLLVAAQSAKGWQHHDNQMPLDAIIKVKLPADYKAAVVLIEEPRPEVKIISNDPDGVIREIAMNISNDNFDAALDGAVKLLSWLRL